MKKWLLKNPSGFTLVELMVVVAIIGILSAIAVPNFKKYQAKSKQSEAKIQLAAVYNAEVGAQADYDTFATCIADIGYETPPKGYYLVGFSATESTSAGIITGRSGTCGGTFNVAPTQQLQAISGVVPAASDLSSTAPTNTTFVAAAAGNIAGKGAYTMDKWTINEGKSLKNSQIGY